MTIIAANSYFISITDKSFENLRPINNSVNIIKSDKGQPKKFKLPSGIGNVKKTNN